MEAQELFKRLKAGATQVDAAMQLDLKLVRDPLLSEVLHHAIFNGGKRIRPLLTVFSGGISRASHKGVSPHEDSDLDRRQRLHLLAIVFEYLHAASLLHDDVIDHAEQRRGLRTVNAIWGATPAILAGDYLHARAMTLAALMGGEECLKIVGDAITAMVEAEFLQLRHARSLNLSAGNYFAVLHGKTAALISAACEAGVLWAGGCQEQRAAMRTYGANLGLAFQIVDDLLDYQGDPGRTGKKTGNDFFEGKMTLPLIHTMARATASDCNFFRNQPQFNPDPASGTMSREPHEKTLDSLNQARQIIDKYDGFREARRQAEDLIRTGLLGLNIFPDNEEKEILVGLAGYVLNREN